MLNTKFFSALVSLLFIPISALAQRQFDLLIYGATPAGIMAAVAAKEEGASAVIIEPTDHIGGMVTAGLGASDICNESTIAGLSRKFFESLGKKYGRSIAWRFEAHLADQVFSEIIAQHKIEILKQTRISAVSKQGRRISAAKLSSGAEISAKVFIDATYEGDLLPLSGVSYALGRESRAEYGESLAGVTVPGKPEKHSFPPSVSALTPDGKLLAHVTKEELGSKGSGDRKIPAYNFRPCLTNDQNNKITFSKPANYDPKEYELVARTMLAKPTFSLSDVLNTLKIPNNKIDLNNSGPFSTDLIGGSAEYPEASYEKRREIWERHKSYIQGLLYYLMSDEHVLPKVRQIMTEWGICADEFKKSNNWPAQLYVRAARRMLGEYVMKQSDLRRNRTKEDSVGLASCPIESHHVQRVVVNGAPVNEGYLLVKINPYEISYRALLPKPEQAENLLVPVTLSSTHIAYSSIRMEPVYMILGESAGVAAAMSLKNDGRVASIDIAEFQAKLLSRGQRIKL